MAEWTPAEQGNAAGRADNAHTAYLERRVRIEALMARLRDELIEMDAAEARNTRNWGHAGDAGRVIESLEGIITVLELA